MQTGLVSNGNYVVAYSATMVIGIPPDLTIQLCTEALTAADATEVRRHIEDIRGDDELRPISSVGYYARAEGVYGMICVQPKGRHRDSEKNLRAVLAHLLKRDRKDPKQAASAKKQPRRRPYQKAGPIALRFRRKARRA